MITGFSPPAKFILEHTVYLEDSIERVYKIIRMFSKKLGGVLEKRRIHERTNIVKQRSIEGSENLKELTEN